MAGKISALDQPTLEQISAILDNRTEAERLAKSISLSLRNMDISMEHIAEFYHEKLVDHMASGRLREGERTASTYDQILYAHVHSFFMHLGAARDYLAAFCAIRIGENPEKIDSFARLTANIRPKHFEIDSILQIFYEKGYFLEKSGSSTKFELAGWMKEVTDLRNELIHRRSYGDRFLERAGYIKAVNHDAGLYRYIRPIVFKNNENDVQNFILRHYQEMTSLCHATAVASGNNIDMKTISDDDIISAEIK